MADKWFGRWKDRVKDLKSQVYALYLACRDPRVPWFAKAFGAMVLAYALSPIDLIPKEIMGECKRKAVVALSSSEVKTWPATLVIVAIWGTVLGCVVWRIIAR